MVTTIDQLIADFFNNNFSTTPLADGEFSWGNLILCAIAVLLSLILCGAIGLERESKGRSAGLRTHLLVGVGSCVIMIISIYGFPKIFANRDVARLAAQVVAGVGFLGAGAIIHHDGGIKGLTTASTIWLVMAIGLCCGSMNFIIAIGVTVIVMFVLIFFKKIELKVGFISPSFLLICEKDVKVVDIIYQLAEKYDCQILDFRNDQLQNGKEICNRITFKVAKEESAKGIDVVAFEKELVRKIKPKYEKLIHHN